MKSHLTWTRWALFVLPLVCFLVLAAPLMLAMTCGAIFAIACEPACQWLTHRLGRFKRLAPLLTVLMVLGFVVTPLLFVVGFGRADFATLSSKLGDLQKASVIEGMSKQTTVAINSIGLHVKSSSVLNGMREAVDATHGWLRGVVKASVKGTADALLALTIFLLTFYVWLREHQRLQAVAIRLLPLAPAQALRFVRMVRDSSVDAVVGACLVGLVQAGVLLVALLLLGVPGAWLLAIVAFFLSFVPVVGTVPVTGFTVIYLLVEDEPTKALIMFAAAWVVGASDNVLRLVIRPRGDTPALVSFIAMIGGLELVGLSGLFIGPVVAGLATWGIRELVRYRAPRIERTPVEITPAGVVHNAAPQARRRMLPR